SSPAADTRSALDSAGICARSTATLRTGGSSSASEQVGAGRLAYRVREAAQQIGLSERATWRLVATGQLQVVRAGRATIIPAAVLEGWLSRQLEEHTNE